MARLIVLAGLPAVGKSSIAHEVARRIGAIWLRIDTMDQAIWASGTAPEDLRDWTYRAAQATAADNLALGHDVIADCVNDCADARAGWNDAARQAGAEVMWLEIMCGDPAEHRRRIETRECDVPGLKLPDWEKVSKRDFQEMGGDVARIDTAGRTVGACVEEALSLLAD